MKTTTMVIKTLFFCVYTSLCFNRVQSGHTYSSEERNVVIRPGKVYNQPVALGAVTTFTGCFRFEVSSDEPVIVQLMEEERFNEFKSSNYTERIRYQFGGKGCHRSTSCTMQTLRASSQKKYVLAVFNREINLPGWEYSSISGNTATVSIKTVDKTQVGGTTGDCGKGLPHSSDGGGGTPKAALIGGIVGGVVFLIVLIVIGLGTYFYFKKKRSANTPSTVPASSLDMVKKEDVEKGPGIHQAAQQMDNLQTMKMDEDLTEVNTGMISLVDDTPPPAANISFEVMVPAGTAPGTLLQVTVPDGYPKAGQTMQFQVPSGLPAEGGKVAIPLPQ